MGQAIAQRAGSGIPAHANRLRPGVYKTESHTCIVVVPGSHTDDAFATVPAGGEWQMPIVKPDLRFVPPRPAAQ
jgi:hypothetical protein